MAVFGNPRTFHKKFKFVIEIDNIRHAGFRKCSELSAEIAVIEQSEGGSLISEKSPGRLKVNEITLERGAAQDSDLWDWWKQVCDQTADAGGGAGGLGAGVKEPDLMRTADIVQLDRDGEELRRWTLDRCWPSKFVAGDWDNEADENVIESMTIQIHTFDKTFGV